MAFARHCPGSPVRLFLRHALDDDQTDTAFHLELVQRVLARFEFSFWFFDLATLLRTSADGNQKYGGLPLSFLYGILGTAVILLQFYNALVSGVFSFFYAAVIFQLAIGTLQFALMILLPPDTSET